MTTPIHPEPQQAEPRAEPGTHSEEPPRLSRTWWTSKSAERTLFGALGLVVGGFAGGLPGAVLGLIVGYLAGYALSVLAPILALFGS